MEPLYRRFFYHGRCPWLASAVCAGAPRQRYSRRLDAAGRTGCQPAGGAAGLLRYPRFQLLALAACADAGGTLLGRVHRHLGGDDGDGRAQGGARRGARHADQCQRARRSRSLRPLHGRTGILDPDPRRNGRGIRRDGGAGCRRTVDAVALGARRLRSIPACKRALDL